MKKGFTLIELLAVIVILSVVTLITIPMITNVIEESKKKALASSIQGLVESANLYAIENDGVYEFLFDKEHKGSTIKGESLDYRGTIDGKGKLYLDREGNVSVCISNDAYYVYKNYNSGIIVGERKTGNCIIGFDALTNKYVAMLDNGTGNVSNVYSKDEVDNLVSNLGNIYATKEELNNSMNNLSSMITANQTSINNLNSNLMNIKYLPDYNNAISITSQTYTLPSDGIIAIITGDGKNMGARTYYMNGVVVAHNSVTEGWVSSTIIGSKGDIFSIDYSVWGSCTFIPFK